MVYECTPIFTKVRIVNYIVVSSEIGLLPWVAMAWIVLMFRKSFSLGLSEFQASASFTRFVSISYAASVPYVVVKWVIMTGINALAYPYVLSSIS